MSLHLADGFTNFATFFVPAVLLALMDRAKPEQRPGSKEVGGEPGEQL